MTSTMLYRIEEPSDPPQPPWRDIAAELIAQAHGECPGDTSLDGTPTRLVRCRRPECRCATILQFSLGRLDWAAARCVLPGSVEAYTAIVRFVGVDGFGYQLERINWRAAYGWAQIFFGRYAPKSYWFQIDPDRPGIDSEGFGFVLPIDGQRKPRSLKLDELIAFAYAGLKAWHMFVTRCQFPEAAK